MLELLKRPKLLTRKVIGKIHRNLITIPDEPVPLLMGSGIVFDARYQPFLNEDDYRAILTGSYDIILQDFLRRHLSPGDIFIDVGSNIGYVAAVAASVVGNTGEVHGFEPLRECFDSLVRLKARNPEAALFFNNVALGAEQATLPIAFNPQHNSREATLVPGHQEEVSYEVPVVRLDDYILSNIKEPGRISVIKIDVEGFEFPVLLGLERLFEQHRPVIVCEYKPWELPRLGYTAEEFESFMGKFGYQAHDMLDTNKKIDMQALDDLEILLFNSRTLPASPARAPLT